MQRFPRAPRQEEGKAPASFSSQPAVFLPPFAPGSAVAPPGQKHPHSAPPRVPRHKGCQPKPNLQHIRPSWPPPTLCPLTPPHTRLPHAQTIPPPPVTHTSMLLHVTIDAWFILLVTAPSDALIFTKVESAMWQKLQICAFSRKVSGSVPRRPRTLCHCAIFKMTT